MEAHAYSELPQGDWWPYSYQWLPTDLLRIEKFEAGHPGRGFQRGLNQPFIKRGTDHFNPAMIEPLVVVRVRGAGGEVWYSVIDGQHRFHIIQRRRLVDAPCLVHHRDLSYCERSGLFTRLNFDRRRLTGEQYFAGRYEERDDDVLAIIELVEAHGFYIKGFLVDDTRPRKRLGCIPTLLFEYRRDAAALAGAMRCLETWAQHDLSYEGPIIKALCVLARSDKFREDHMKHVLDKRLPAYVNNLAMERDPGKQRPTARGFQAAFVELYNRRLSPDNRLDPDA